MSHLDRHTMELGAAAAIALFGGLIVAGSLQLHTGWLPETGPQPGYAPLRLGIALCVVSVLIFLGALRSKTTGQFVSGEQFRRTLSVFIPTLVLVISMPFLGCYAPSFVYLFYMLKTHGGMTWLKSAVISLAITIAFFLIFDIWFKVDLAKGPVESFLGL